MIRISHSSASGKAQWIRVLYRAAHHRHEHRLLGAGESSRPAAVGPGVDMGSSQNVTTFTPSHDALAPVGTEGSFIEPIKKMSISIPLLPSLRMPPLAQQKTQPRRTKLMRCTAGKNPFLAASAALAERMNAPDSVTATGELVPPIWKHTARPPSGGGTWRGKSL